MVNQYHQLLHATPWERTGQVQRWEGLHRFWVERLGVWANGGRDMPTDEAKSELARLEHLHATWTERQAKAQAQLTELEANAGSLAVDGADPDAVSRHLAERRAAADVAQKALAELTGRIAQAKANVFFCQAADLHREAEERQAALREHQGQIAEIMAMLVEIEGVEYVPPPPLTDSQIISLGRQDNRPLPRSQVMQGEIYDLVERAAQLEKRAMAIKN